MKRRLFILATTLSLLLCCASVALWYRGAHGEIDWISYTTVSGRGLGVGSSRHHFAIWAYRYTTDGPDRGRGWDFRPYRSLIRWDWEVKPSFWNRIGFGYYYSNHIRKQTADSHGHLVYLPHWSACFAYAVLPSVWSLAAVRRFRRIETGQCSTCGYDLRATPDRCPECGTEPAIALK